MNVSVPVVDRCTKLNLYRAVRSVEMTPTASRVLQFLIDDVSAPFWSLKRMSLAVGRKPRTVDAAIAELKRLGFVSVHYRRRQTSVKVLAVGAILEAVSRAVAIAKAAAKTAISMYRRGLSQASQIAATNIHLSKKIGAESAFTGGPSNALLRSLGLPIPERRF